MEYTSGPWEYIEGYDNEGNLDARFLIERADGEGGVIAEVYTKKDVDLIISAPDMYEALQKISSGIDKDLLGTVTLSREDMQEIAKNALEKVRNDE